MGWLGLCSFTRPFMVGVEGFRFLCFHAELEGMRYSLCFMVSSILVWKSFVGSMFVVWKLFPFMKSCILLLYWLVGRITMEFPLSACAMVALFCSSFVLIDFAACSSS